MGGRYTLDDWNAVRERLRLGDTVRGAAEACGVNRGAVLRWSHMGEPPDWMVAPMGYEVDPEGPAPAGRSAGQRLSFEDRAYIAAMSSQGCGPAEIALKVGVHRTTVARELARCAEGAYDPREAHLDARRRARRPKARKLEEGRLRGHVASKLALLWSPRQISMRLREEFPDEEEMRVSHEAIYQALYVQGRGSLRQEVAVEQALRSGRKRRAPRSRLPARARGRSWVEGCGISERPPEAADRAVPGHWEGDLVVGGDMASCLVTLVERRTRFLVARRLMAHEDGGRPARGDVRRGAGRRARRAALDAHLGPGLRAGRRGEVHARDGGEGLLLRPPLPLAEGDQREHQRPREAVLPEGHEVLGGERRGRAGDAGSAQRAAEGDARLEDAGRGATIGAGKRQPCNDRLTPPGYLVMI